MYVDRTNEIYSFYPVPTLVFPGDKTRLYWIPRDSEHTWADETYVVNWGENSALTKTARFPRDLFYPGRIVENVYPRIFLPPKTQFQSSQLHKFFRKRFLVTTCSSWRGSDAKEKDEEEEEEEENNGLFFRWPRAIPPPQQKPSQ